MSAGWAFSKASNQYNQRVTSADIDKSCSSFAGVELACSADKCVFAVGMGTPFVCLVIVDVVSPVMLVCFRRNLPMQTPAAMPKQIATSSFAKRNNRREEDLFTLLLLQIPMMRAICLASVQ